MSEILSKQTDHGMCEVYLNNGTKCLMAQDGFEYIDTLEQELSETKKKLEVARGFIEKVSFGYGRCSEWTSMAGKALEAIEEKEAK